MRSRRPGDGGISYHAFRLREAWKIVIFTHRAAADPHLASTQPLSHEGMKWSLHGGKQNLPCLKSLLH